MSSGEDRQPPQDDLDRRLAAARAELAGRDGSGEGGKAGSAPLGRSERKSFGLALRIGSDLVAAVVVGAGIGWLLDSWLGTAPWLFVVFFVLGCAAGIRNVIRIAMLVGAAAEAQAQAPADAGAKGAERPDGTPRQNGGPD